jgi:hypothetical protein
MIFVSCISFIFYATSSISEAIILLIIKDMEGANILEGVRVVKRQLQYVDYLNVCR